MPKRTDLHTIMIIGSGPIVIGQGCEFDYSGVQACKVLRAQGYRVVLVNSNPATIMTDPEFADATYVEPLTPEMCERIIAQEQPDALLPTVGGQTALNLAKALAENGALERHNVELIGAKFDSIELAEDRQLFKDAMIEIGLRCPPSEVVSSVEGALASRRKAELSGAGAPLVHARRIGRRRRLRRRTTAPHRRKRSQAKPGA